MEKLRVKNYIEIEVNDDGETIKVYAEDDNFVTDFYEAVEKFEAIAEEIENLPADMDFIERIKAQKQKKEVIADIIDNVFGEDTCRKVFSGHSPSILGITDFFDALLPILEKYATDRHTEIAKKYNANRKGNKYRR